MISKVISVCTKADAETFSIASDYIQENIGAKRYVVIVPERDLNFFSSLDLGNFQVESEEKYSEIFSYLQKKGFDERLGWYFQQFIKMSELAEGADNDINLIWDADTIPLRPISFTNSEKILFYQGAEYHAPYFRVIKDLLGTDKLSETSFIAQCLPYQVKWFHKFKADVEAQKNRPWFETIIDLIDPNEQSGFSEYETLGTFALQNFPSDIVLNTDTKNWYRHGNSLISGPENISRHQERLSRNFAFISFEKWDSKRVSHRKLLKLRAKALLKPQARAA